MGGNLSKDLVIQSAKQAFAPSGTCLRVFEIELQDILSGGVAIRDGSTMGTLHGVTKVRSASWAGITKTDSQQLGANSAYAKIEALESICRHVT